jgi:hypothetical protein
MHHRTCNDLNSNPEPQGSSFLSCDRWRCDFSNPKILYRRGDDTRERHSRSQQRSVDWLDRSDPVGNNTGSGGKKGRLLLQESRYGSWRDQQQQQQQQEERRGCNDNDNDNDDPHGIVVLLVITTLATTRCPSSAREA